jgi:hypothetical protein
VDKINPEIVMRPTLAGSFSQLPVHRKIFHPLALTHKKALQEQIITN